MKYEDLFRPENVLILAKYTDKTQERFDLTKKRSEDEFIVEFNILRRKLFDKDMAAAEAISRLA